MFIGSDNQFRNLYVMKAYKNNESAIAAVGDLTLKVDNAKSNVYLVYKDTEDAITSDLISIKNLLYAKSTKAADMARKLNSQSVTLKADPVSGQDYVLNVEIRNFVALGDDSTHIKFGAVHAVKDMTKSDFYKAMALNLAKNLSREVVPLIKIEVHSAGTTSKGGFDSAGYMVVTPTTKDNGKSDTTNPYYDGTSAVVADIDSIRITEVEQPWRLGIMAQTPVDFTAQPTTVLVNGDDRIWGTVTEGTNGTVGNGKAIADLEYFCMGERGDVYRGIGFPHNIPTTYLVDPSKTYYTFDIHYAYVGSNEAVQKSEKTITIVSTDKTDINSLITAFNSASGLNVATFS